MRFMPYNLITFNHMELQMRNAKIALELGLGLEDLTPQPLPIDVQQENEIPEELIINGMDIHEMVDEARAESARVASLESLVNNFTSLRSGLLSVSTETISENGGALAHNAISATFAGADLDVPRAIREAVAEKDYNTAISFGLEAADNIIKRAINAIIEALKLAIKKAIDIFNKLREYGKQAGVYGANLVSSLISIAGKLTSKEVKLSAYSAATISINGDVVTDQLPIEVQRLLNEAKTVCKVPLLDKFIADVGNAVRTAESADSLKETIRELFSEHTSHFKYTNHNLFIGDYVLDKDERGAITFTREGGSLRNAPDKVVAFKTKVIIEAINALLRGKREWSPSSNELGKLSAKQTAVLEAITKRTAEESFGNPQSAIMLFSYYVQRSIANYSAMNLHINRVERVLFNIAESLKVSNRNM